MKRTSQLDESNGTPLLPQGNGVREYYGTTAVEIPPETSFTLPKNNPSNAHSLPFCVIRHIFRFMLMHDGRKDSDVSSPKNSVDRPGY